MNVQALTHQMILLFIIIFIGYFAIKMKLLPGNANKVIANLIVNITCPATTLYAVATSSRALSNFTVFGIMGVTILILGGQILLAGSFTAAFRIKQPQSGIYRFMLVFSNCGFLGFPVVQALFGGDAVFIASMYNLIFQILCFTYGVNQVSCGTSDNRFHIKMICTPMVFASVGALFLYIFNIPFPTAAVEVLSLLDKITPPASMLVIGCALASYPLKQIFGDWKMYIFCIFRLIVIPVLVWLLVRPIVPNNLIFGVLVVLSALPAASNTAIFAAKYDGDEATAASGLFLSTILCLFTLPLLLNLLF